MGEGDDSSASKSSTTEHRGVVAATPYSLHASDNPGALITSVTLTGENYNEWASEMTNALRAKRKLGFIEGTIPQPATGDPNLELWFSVNSMIVGWIRTSIESRVRSTVTFIQDSHKLWVNLRKRFSVGNRVRIHHLKEQLARCKQEGQSVIDYFGRLSKMWEELDMYSPLPKCTCSAIIEFEKAREAEKIHQFVMGLDESRFGKICQSIISSDSELDIGEIYAKIIREEQRLNSSKDRETQQLAVGFIAKTNSVSDQQTSRTNSVGPEKRDRVPTCSHCGRRGHDKAGCWQLIGFPDWWEDRPPNRGNNGSNRGAGRGGRGRGNSSSRNTDSRVNNAHATTSNSSTFPEFTQEQWQALTQMVNERARPSNDKLSGKNRHGDLILDTGASYQMTGDMSLLTHTVSITPCPVGFADGNKTFATHMGVFPLSDKITLENVLFVPNLNCSLISVSKLLKQTNCFALLTDTICILQDRFTRTLIGAGEERDGIYYFKDVMAARVHRVTDQVVSSVDQFRWHQRLGHPSFTILSSLPMFSSNKNADPSPCDTCFRAK